jgi:peptidyl-prolyl cis-trans isomerase D
MIPGIGGQRVVAVSEIEAGGEISLAEARDEIEQSLRRDAARDAYTDILDQVEELRAAFQPLDEIGERYGIPVHQVTMTASGGALESVASIAPENRQRVATTVFEAEEDRLTPTIALSANNNIFVELGGIEPARDRTLDEVRDEVAAAITEERTNASLDEAVADMVARLEAGDSFADVALLMNTFPTLSPALSRDGTSLVGGLVANDPALDQIVAAAAFEGGDGHVGSAVNALGEHVVFQVVEVVPASNPATEQLQDYLQQAQEQSLYTAFVTGLRDQAGVRINRQALDQVLGLSQTGQ